MSPHDFVQRLESLAASTDDEGLIAFTERNYQQVAQSLSTEERRIVGSIMHTARMAVAMKLSAARSSSGEPGTIAPVASPAVR